MDIFLYSTDILSLMNILLNHIELTTYWRACRACSSLEELLLPSPPRLIDATYCYSSKKAGSTLDLLFQQHSLAFSMKIVVLSIYFHLNTLLHHFFLAPRHSVQLVVNRQLCQISASLILVNNILLEKHC